jgi:hypothetical protein
MWSLHFHVPAEIVAMANHHWAAAIPFCAVLLASACIPPRARSQEHESGVSLRVQPETVLVDQQTSIVAMGLRPGQTATLIGTLKRDSVHVLVSRAVFRANDQGAVDVATDAPDSGTYSGVDARGLVWSLAPEDHRAPQESRERSAGHRRVESLSAREHIRHERAAMAR